MTMRQLHDLLAQRNVAIRRWPIALFISHRGEVRSAALLAAAQRAKFVSFADRLMNLTHEPVDRMRFREAPKATLSTLDPLVRDGGSILSVPQSSQPSGLRTL